MNLKEALDVISTESNDKDILELVWINFREDFLLQEYYSTKIWDMHRWDYFISDLDWTFFRGVLQKEAFTLFVKFVKKHNYFDLNLEDYYLFLKDLEFFNELEKKAYNKEIEYFEYLNAWIYLMIKHKNLIIWDDYLSFVKYSFKSKEKINPFRFSIQKLKEILEKWDNFLFISGAPSFIFEIYLELLKWYISKNIWSSYSNNVFWFWSNVFLDNDEFTPLWWRSHKKEFISILKKTWVINKTIWWMGDTSSDFWISYWLDNWNKFYFVNPERKVIDNFDIFKDKRIEYDLIIERKDLIFSIKKEDINLS